MAKLTSLDDLRSLLSDNDIPQRSPDSGPKPGYDGKPQRLTVRLDRSGRRGKTATLITGFQSTPEELESIAASLKQQCGTGGRVLDNAIEIQGDHRTTVVEKLSAMEYAVRSI